MLLSPQASHAATFYVATSGDDANPCTQSRPCGTINGGIARMSGGDTLIVGGGTYDEYLADYGSTPIPSGTSWETATTIEAAPGETVWLKVTVAQPGGGGVIEVDKSSSQYILFDGLNIDADHVNGFGVGIASNYIRLQNLEVKNTRGVAIAVSGYYNEFINLHVHDNGSNPTTSVGAHGFYVTGWYNLIDHTRIHDNDCNGIQFTSEGGSVRFNTVQYSEIYNNGCVGVVAYPENYIYNNIIHDNDTGVIMGSSAKAFNNVVYNNHEIGIWPEGSNQEIKNNIVIGHTWDILDQETGSVDFADNVCTAVGVPYTIGCTIAASSGCDRAIPTIEACKPE
jgi:hypothetical protein